MKENSWNPYYEATKEKPPLPFVVEAVKYVIEKNKAMDVGAGALRNAKFLLSEGFEVTTLDKSSESEVAARNLQNEKIHPVTQTFEDFDFPIGEYDLVCAMSSLPFVSPEHYDEVFSKVVNSLKIGGVFCGTFFGPDDSWTDSEKMSFHTKEEIENLLGKFEIILFRETNETKDAVTGEIKHYHRFNTIARKNKE